MIRKVGRLEFFEIHELHNQIDGVNEAIEKKNEKKAEKLMVDIAKSPNYFVREEMGKKLPEYKDQKAIYKLMKKLITHKIYGVRASALMYFAAIYHDKPKKLISVINDVYHNIPWETENIINTLWLKYPNEMKEEMHDWVKSDERDKKILAFQGIEKVGEKDPGFVMEFLDSSIDDEDVEVQKKITHILSQIARARPAEVYPYIREWLSQSNEHRMKTLWVTMKKLSNIISQKHRKTMSSDFVSLTEQTIQDWQNDPNKTVAKFGEKLNKIIKKY